MGGRVVAAGALQRLVVDGGRELVAHADGAVGHKDLVQVQLGSLQGVLEIHPRGYGFLRNPAKDYAPQPSDPAVASALIQRLKLREGLLLGGMCEAFRGSHPPRLLKL